MLNVREIYNYLDQIAPFKNADKTDNAGLLVGDMDSKVKKILVCLDVTNAVVQEAADKHVDLIVAHHPIIYRPIYKVPRADPLYLLIANSIPFIAAHTNLDVAEGGITDLMLTRLGFPESNEVIGPIGSGHLGYGKITDIGTAITAKELAKKCKVAFGCTNVRYVDSGKPIKRVGVCSGGGSDLVTTAFDLGCDAYICGDLRWDRMIFAANYGMTLVDAGHFHTEDIFCEDLVCRLKEAFPNIVVDKAENSVDVCSYR